MTPEISLTIALGVALGGSVGAIVRFLLDRYLRVGLLLANTLGCCVLGYLLGELTWLSENGVEEPEGLFSGPVSTVLIFGLLGALSTFATVSVRAAQTWMAGRHLRAVGTWAAHVGFGFAAAALGIALSRMSGLY
ncbi:CrcB family protein [Nesterenkonia sp. E16_7]|uniref:fluoride efflux transporter FluC n=1 Tax=unclassified Nesterenkonia TaxID=2629769 RepID=UPI001A92969F|nr:MULTISPECIES: CrcB family protein [unclassified Nesterenkonia]MBO0595066.1 CrcB family protein [Nesterenkonia sp. E16_10]MBO0598721.1 CrcB family protein [Nesterenkonia sp. E16_7]